MVLSEVFMLIKFELENAYYKHPDDSYIWQSNIFSKCAIVACEAGEALQASNKFYLEKKGDNKQLVIDELIQVAATAIRTIISETRDDCDCISCK